jgi:hypothetical protein
VQTQVTPPRIEERAISTTPIRITSTPLNEKERFIRINRMVLLPLMAALVTVLFQSFQVGRDAAQKAETLKIEVWKTVQPSFLHMVKNYYSPLLRRTDGIRTQIADDGSTENLLALMFALRRQMLLLLEKDAGYYFQSKPGEELIGLLSNAMVKRWRAEIPDFDGIALKLQGNETLEATREILTNPNSPQAGPAQSLNCGLVAWLESARSAQAGASTEQTQGNTTAPTIAPLTHTAAVDLVTLSSFLDATAGETQKKALEFFKHSLRLFAEVLSFELDRPFYPVWYEKGFPPTVQLAELEGRADKLTWYPKDGRVALADALEIYRMSIPWECVGDDGASPRARWKRIKWRWERMRYWLKHN